VNKYQTVLSEKRVNKYNEENTKAEFIEPLFDALGWDVRNIDHKDEVTREEKISKDRVDYSFRIDGIPKFFLEAKGLRTNLDDPKFAEQAITYSWNKGCTWAVLTDFEAIKIFNAEWHSQNFDYSQNHLKTITCHELINRFDELWLLSKESFEEGLLDKESENWGKKIKKRPVDKQLLEDFTSFRGILFRNILKLNSHKNLKQEEIDQAIQRILDRLIFIRNSEDRELEEKQLIYNLRTWEERGKGQLLRYLRQVFTYFDTHYNSRIFARHLCDELEIENEILHEIIEGMYYTKNRSISYDFSAIEADVLGSMYEQYLGHVLKTTKKRVTLLNNETHRKEQGVFYTPTYVVDYIVRNTLGRTLEDKKCNPDNIKILDPACGSGSFLIKAFDLLNEYYKTHDKDYSQTNLDLSVEGGTYTKKLKIIQNNLFGVDLDKQAVEVAQLNLLLKIAEKGQRLPLLQQNIQNGNSLIDDKEIAGDKSFDWETRFKGIAGENKFDVIVGNPPYIQLSMEENLTDTNKKYLLNRYKSSMGRLNTFGFFIRLGIDLLKDGGRLGYIVPNTILTQDYYSELRKEILDSCEIESIVNFQSLPFKDAIVENVIIVIRKSPTVKKRNANQISIYTIDNQSKLIKQKLISQVSFNQNKKYTFNLQIDQATADLRLKIEKGSNALENFLLVNQAIALKHDRNSWVTTDKFRKKAKPLLVGGKNIDRYSIKWDGSYLIYDLKGIHSCKTESIFLTKEKIIFRRVSRRLIATLDIEQFYGLHTLVIMNLKVGVPHDLRYFLAIFNSKLMTYYYQKVFASTKTIFSEIGARQVEQLPIRITSKEKEEQVVKLVEKMLTLNNKLTAFGDKKTDERARIEDDIKDTDEEIDELVYQIYNITGDEKKIIENKTLLQM
jgi:type I restriction-modification system DNA methylase subunit